MYVVNIGAHGFGFFRCLEVSFELEMAVVVLFELGLAGLGLIIIFCKQIIESLVFQTELWDLGLRVWGVFDSLQKRWRCSRLDGTTKTLQSVASPSHAVELALVSNSRVHRASLASHHYGPGFVCVVVVIMRSNILRRSTQDLMRITECA